MDKVAPDWENERCILSKGKKTNSKGVSIEEMSLNYYVGIFSSRFQEHAFSLKQALVDHMDLKFSLMPPFEYFKKQS